MKPMLAYSITPEDVKLPCVVSPKIDGIRAIAGKTGLFSRKLKILPNKHLQFLYNHLEMDTYAFDGEITIGFPFEFEYNYNAIQSAVMSQNDKRALWVYNVFDLYDNPSDYFLQRANKLESILQYNYNESIDDHGKLIIRTVPQIVCYTRQNLINYAEMFIDKGYEGIMTRSLYSPYKHGRSTKKEQYLCKIKKYMETECKLVGVTQYQENLSESFLNALSYKEKHQYKENVKFHEKVGSLVLEHPKHGKIYVGTGLNDKLRERIWQYFDQFQGQTVKIKYWGITNHGKLRFPAFVGFRNTNID